MVNVKKCQCLENNLQSSWDCMYSCNPTLIEPLIVPDEIKAYRIWRFTIQNGFNTRWMEKNSILE